MEDFFRRLNLELIRRGIWGRTAEMFQQDLRDHYLTARKEILDRGGSSEEADTLALGRLGDPIQLANEARVQLSRRDEGFKTQFLLRVVPLCLGPFSFATTLGILWKMFEFMRPPIGSRPPQLLHPETAVTHMFGAMVLFYYLGPWLSAYLWVLRASYHPLHSWRYLLLLSGYLTLSYYFCASWILTTNDGVNLYFDPQRVNAGLLFLCLLLLITPWRVRAWKKAAAGNLGLSPQAW